MAGYMVVGLEEDHGRNGWTQSQKTVNHGILHFCRHADLLKKERSGRDWCLGCRGAHQSRNGLKWKKWKYIYILCNTAYKSNYIGHIYNYQNIGGILICVPIIYIYIYPYI